LFIDDYTIAQADLTIDEATTLAPRVGHCATNCAFGRRRLIEVKEPRHPKADDDDAKERRK
jgi:hypothetical protein